MAPFSYIKCRNVRTLYALRIVLKMLRFCAVVLTVVIITAGCPSLAPISGVIGIEVVYQGDACECDKSLSFCVDRPREAAGVQL